MRAINPFVQRRKIQFLEKKSSAATHEAQLLRADRDNVVRQRDAFAAEVDAMALERQQLLQDLSREGLSKLDYPIARDG